MRSSTRMKVLFFNATLLVLNILFFNVRAAGEMTDQAHYKVEIDFGNESVFSTFLDLKLDADAFSLSSPRNADIRCLGSKARLGRLAGKLPKHGCLMRIRGTRKADSLFGETVIPFFGRLTFSGKITDSLLTGQLSNPGAMPVGTVQGVRSAEFRVDYTSLYPKLLRTVTDNIYSTSTLQTAGWRRFDKKAKALCNTVHDDIELYFGYNILARKLPFTHLSLVITRFDESDTTAEESVEEVVNTPKSVVYEQKDSNTAFLRIRNFSSSQGELAAILPDIVSNPALSNLVLDLRDNGGGGVSAAFELAKYIVSRDLEVGYFVTNKLRYSGFEPEKFRRLPAIQSKSTQALGNDLKTTPGLKMIFRKPENPVFSGKIFVLTNGGTASTCEPIVYALKTSKMATIIGEKTYGGMLSASPFVASGKYMLMVPIADFYTFDGVRLDKVGVQPDIEVKSADAEAKVMELIRSSTR